MNKSTETGRMRMRTEYMFVTSFVNTAVLMILINGDFSAQGFFGSAFGVVYSGNISDFNRRWWNKVGNALVVSMIFNAFFPYLKFAFFFTLNNIIRWIDRGFQADRTKTKKTSIYSYVDLYSGEQFDFAEKYSSIIMVAFVTMMYGIGMPILFPVGAFGFIMMYMVHKSKLFWAHQRPPMFDDELNNYVLNTLTYAPILMLGFGFWMLTNPEMFSNEVVWKQRYNDDPTEHVWTDVFFGNMLAKNPQALPIFIAFWFFLITIFFRNFLYSAITKCFPSMKIGAFHIEEDLPNYFAAVDDHDRNWSIKEEENSRNNLRMTIMMDETLEKLKTTEPSRKCLQGVHCYDILANLSYVD